MDGEEGRVIRRYRKRGCIRGDGEDWLGVRGLRGVCYIIIVSVLKVGDSVGLY